jgi:hypothetical protein
MNLQNLSDNEFDQQVKGHLDDSEIPYDPSSWNKMDKKLNIVFPLTGANNGSMVGLTIFALLLSIKFFWNVSNFPITANNADQAMAAGDRTTHDRSINLLPQPEADESIPSNDVAVSSDSLLSETTKDQHGKVSLEKNQPGEVPLNQAGFDTPRSDTTPIVYNQSQASESRIDRASENSTSVAYGSTDQKQSYAGNVVSKGVSLRSNIPDDLPV